MPTAQAQLSAISSAARSRSSSRVSTPIQSTSNTHSPFPRGIRTVAGTPMTIRLPSGECAMTDKASAEIDPSAPPSGTGCLECERIEGWLFHLRRCATCGHIGCCDSSPNQHASKHNAATGHPVITSFEPGEHWFYDYRTGEMFAGPKLHAPHSHPADQPVPG